MDVFVNFANMKSARNALCSVDINMEHEEKNLDGLKMKGLGTHHIRPLRGLALSSTSTIYEFILPHIVIFLRLILERE